MKLITSITLLIVSLFILGNVSLANETANEYQDPYIEAKGVVLEILNESPDESLEMFSHNQIIQTVKIKIINGSYKDKEYIIENMLSDNPAFDIRVKAGDEVLLNIEENDTGEAEVNIANYYRFPALTVLFIVFCSLVVVFGGIKGIKSLISLGITYFLIFYFLIPNILNGAPPLLLTIIISIIATCATIFLISGINLKSASAIIGTVGGVSAAGITAIITIKAATLSGLPNQEAIGLWATSQDLPFKGILASAMIIGALGASMDVGISIASSIYEVKKANPEATKSYLIKSGMNVGKDIMGTMTNTLLLAYTGSAIFLLLLAYNNVSFMKFINLDSIVTEITAALAGSIGLVLCIPITALSAGYLLTLTKAKES